MSLETHKLASLIAAVLAVAAAVGLALAQVSGSSALLAAAAGLLPAALTALVAAAQLRLRRREWEQERAAGGDSGGRLFSDESIFLDARRSREQFERIVVPAFAVLVAVGLAGLARWLQLAARGAATPPERVLFAAGAAAGLAFAAFLAGRVVGAVAEERDEPLLRPAADWLLGVAPAALLAAAAALAARDELPPAERLLTLAVAVVYALAAADQLLTLGLELFRARAAGGAEHALYEPRLVHLATHPRRLVENLAGTLDYQFGWQVSRTELYAALRGLVVPLVAAQVLVLWLTSSFVCLLPHEQGLRERFGRVLDGPVLEGGLHLILPWPIERVRRYPADRLQTVTLGLDPGAEDAGAVVAWANEQGHAHEPFVVASAGQGAEGVGLLAAEIEVAYRVSDLRRFATRCDAAEGFLADLTWREATRMFAGSDLLAVMSRGGGPAAAELRARLQARCDALGLGVTIVSMGFRDVHPPAEAMPVFEGVAAAGEEAQASRLRAEAEAAQTVPRAEAAAARTRAAAEAERAQRAATAPAEAELFRARAAASAQAPGLYRLRAAVDTLVSVLAGRKKAIVAGAGAREVTTVDLAGKLPAGLLDVPLAKPGDKDTTHE